MCLSVFNKTLKIKVSDIVNEDDLDFRPDDESPNEIINTEYPDNIKKYLNINDQSIMSFTINNKHPECDTNPYYTASKVNNIHSTNTESCVNNGTLNAFIKTSGVENDLQKKLQGEFFIMEQTKKTLSKARSKSVSRHKTKSISSESVKSESDSESDSESVKSDSDSESAKSESAKSDTENNFTKENTTSSSVRIETLSRKHKNVSPVVSSSSNVERQKRGRPKKSTNNESQMNSLDSSNLKNKNISTIKNNNQKIKNNKSISKTSSYSDSLDLDLNLN